MEWWIYKIIKFIYNWEYNLINTLLKADKSLLKIYHLFINSQTKVEKKYYQKIEKQLKLYINEAFSYFRKKI